MTPTDQCPQCDEPLTRVGKHLICPEHGQISPRSSRSESAHTSPEVSSPLCIFLSYGHDANEELVRRIKTDLEARGHDVWYDQTEIKAGDDWRREITDGVVGSHRVLSFLSKHSTRDPGVCRDEIAIALGVKGGNIQTILVESEQEVQPPVNISHVQWLDMHDWKERRAASDAAWEEWYQAKYAEILRVVESDESRRFAGEIETLNRHLKPIRSDARVSQLLSKGFYGRQWLFEAVENWRKGSACHSVRADSEKETPPSPLGGERAGVRGESRSRLFWIMGAPGVGKSAFAAQLTHTRGDTVIAAQFCEWDKPDHRNPSRIVRSIAFQLATRLPDYRKLLQTLPEIAELDRKDAAELFDYLLANPLRSVIHGGRERYLIVIDALDEAGSASSAGEPGHNPLVDMLARNAQRLPDWLGFVVTSRPEFDVKTPLQTLNPFPLDTQTESNRADISDYLRRELATPLQNCPDSDRLVGQILKKSEGVFLYVERFCDDVQRGHLSLDHPEQFPQGLGGIFCQYFQRQFPDLEKFRKDVRPVLRAILAAREPLPVEILQRLFNWQDEELRDFTCTLGSIFPVTKEANSEVIKPNHKSLKDWLVDQEKCGCWYVSEREGVREIAEFTWSEFLENSSNMSHFSIRNVQHYQLSAGHYERLERIQNSTWFRKQREKLNIAHCHVSPHASSALTLARVEIPQKISAAISRIRSAAGNDINNSEVCAVVLSGNKASGKTRAALEYAESYAHDYSKVFAVGAENGLDQALEEIRGTMEFDGVDDGVQDNQTRLDTIVRALASLPNWLMILDEMPSNLNLGTLNRLKRLCRHGDIIITSRDYTWGDHFAIIHIKGISTSESAAYLLQSTESSRTRTSNDLELASEVAAIVGSMPLALEMASSIIARDKLSFLEYIENRRTTRHT